MSEIKCPVKWDSEKSNFIEDLERAEKIIRKQANGKYNPFEDFHKFNNIIKKINKGEIK